MIQSSSERLTLLWSFFHTQLFHQGSSLLLELGPHKDREKDWPGWGLNPIPIPIPIGSTQGQRKTLTRVGYEPKDREKLWPGCGLNPIPKLGLIPDGIIGYEKLDSSARPSLELWIITVNCYWRTKAYDYLRSVCLQ